MMSGRILGPSRQVSLTLLTIFLASCMPTALETPAPAETPAAEPTPAATNAAPVQPIEGEFAAFTHIRPDGNHLAQGRGAIHTADPLDIPLAGEPRWVLGLPFAEGSLWVVTLADGSVQVFEAAKEGLSERPGPFPMLAPGEPPHVRLVDGVLEFAQFGLDDTLPLTHPIWTRMGRVYINAAGDLVRELGPEPLFRDALPDARLLQDETGRLLLLTNPTDRYDHAIAGDALEAASFTLLDPDAAAEGPLTIEVAEDRVIEGIFPLWADLNGDDRREIVTTESDLQEGARIVVYREDGERLAASQPIGLGYRWRHVIAAGPFGPDGQLELVEVVTPHLGRIVTYHRLEGEQLTPVASLPGYTSHVIGSRNLDMAAAGDFDGDGQLELLLVSQEGASLAAIQRTDAGAELDWSLPLPGQLVTNLAILTTPAGQLGVGIGTDSNILRLWLP